MIAYRYPIHTLCQGYRYKEKDTDTRNGYINENENGHANGIGDTQGERGLGMAEPVSSTAPIVQAPARLRTVT
jgi:hypothetical protein